MSRTMPLLSNRVWIGVSGISSAGWPHTTYATLQDSPRERSFTKFLCSAARLMYLAAPMRRNVRHGRRRARREPNPNDPPLPM